MTAFAVMTAPAGELSLWHLIVQASWVVKLVMLGLALASVWSWAIIIEKFFAMRRMNSANNRFEQVFWSGQSLEDLYRSMGNRNSIGLAAIFTAAMREWKRSQDAALRAGFQGVQKRIEKVMDVQIQKEMHDVEARLLFLATTGSAAPSLKTSTSPSRRAERMATAISAPSRDTTPIGPAYKPRSKGSYARNA